MADGPLSSITNIVVLMLENRSFDHMLGFLYGASNNTSPTGQPFEGLTGTESNPDKNGATVPVYKIQASDANAYFMPGADPGEGYTATIDYCINNAIMFTEVRYPHAQTEGKRRAFGRSSPSRLGVVG